MSSTDAAASLASAATSSRSPNSPPLIDGRRHDGGRCESHEVEATQPRPPGSRTGAAETDREVRRGVAAVPEQGCVAGHVARPPRPRGSRPGPDAPRPRSPDAPRCPATTGSPSAGSSRMTSTGGRSPGRAVGEGVVEEVALRGGADRRQQCSTSPARALRPLARRSASATRRAARAESTEPPHTRGVASPSAIASSLAGLTERSRCGEQATATSSRASATSAGSDSGPRSTRDRYCEHHHRGRQLVTGGRGKQGGVPTGRMLGDQGVLRAGDGHADSRGVRPRRGGWRHWRRRNRPAPASRPGPGTLPNREAPGRGQATNGTGHDSSSTARRRRESGPAATIARGRSSLVVGHRRGDGVSGLHGLPADPRPRPRRAPGARGRRGAEAVLVVQPGLVEELHGGGPSAWSGRRASSTSSTGTPLRMG